MELFSFLLITQKDMPLELVCPQCINYLKNTKLIYFYIRYHQFIYILLSNNLEYLYRDKENNTELKLNG